MHDRRCAGCRRVPPARHGSEPHPTRRSSVDPRSGTSRVRLEVALRPAHRVASCFAHVERSEIVQQSYVFDVELVGFGDVRRSIAVRQDLTLVDLHYALQSAFGWDDDHLYAFWLEDR